MFSIGKTKINEFQASKWSYNEVIFGVKTLEFIIFIQKRDFW
jgi:hypothetical protein